MDELRAREGFVCKNNDFQRTLVEQWIPDRKARRKSKSLDLMA
jgi:hypothetical protein